MILEWGWSNWDNVFLNIFQVDLLDECLLSTWSSLVFHEWPGLGLGVDEFGVKKNKKEKCYFIGPGEMQPQRLHCWNPGDGLLSKGGSYD